MNIKPPGKIVLSEITYDDFLIYCEAFTDFLKLAKNEADDESKRILFLSVAGLEIRKLVNGLTTADDKFDTLITSLKNYFKPITNLVLERNRFF